MSKKTFKNTLSKQTVKLLDRILTLEANSTSCVFAYEHKIPSELSRFKRKINHDDK